MEKLEKRHHPLYEPLTAIVGSKYVADEDFAVWAYSRDFSPYPAKVPGIIVRPDSIEEVSEIVKLANRTRTPVIPRGGGAMIYGVPPGEPGRSIVVDITRMDNIIDINEENNTVTAEAGIAVTKLRTEVESRVPGRTVVTVLAPHRTVTLGGLLSGGCHFGGAPTDWSTVGATGLYVFGLKVVLPNGDIIQTGPGNINAKLPYMMGGHGPALTPLFFNDAGIFGIKAEATLQMVHKPKISKVESRTFEKLEEAFKVLYTLSKSEPFPYNDLWMATPETLREKDWGIMYCVRGDSDEEVDRKLKVIEQTCDAEGGKPGTTMTKFFAEMMYGTMTRKPGLWEWPKLVHGRMQMFNEWAMPREGYLEHFKQAHKIFWKHKEDFIEKYNIEFFIIMTPFKNNAIFVALDYLYDDIDPATRKAAIELSREIMTFALKSGGIHVGSGMGRTSSYMVASMFPPMYYNFLRTLKKTIDPNNIMNPGILEL